MRIIPVEIADVARWISIEANEAGLTSCQLLDTRPSMPQDNISSPILDLAARQLQEYFAGTRDTFEVPLAPAGTPFQQQVWSTAAQIPFGQTRSYWWIAVRIGNPRAMRAVGGALGANPIPLFIPCHRVVRTDSSLGGFSCGLEWKRMLLDHECGVKAANPVSA